MEVNVEAFTSTYREALRGAVDTEKAIIKTVEQTIRLYQFLAERMSVGDYTGAQYLDALDRAIERAELTESQEDLLDCMIDDMSERDIARTTGMAIKNVSRSKQRLVRKIAIEYAKGDK